MKPRLLYLSLAALLLITPVAATSPATAETGPTGQDWGTGLVVRSLDGSGNNLAHPEWGQAGTEYLRVTPARYADGRSEPVAGPEARYVSNRVFNDINQNLFSEHEVTQWGFVWGQFIDHTIGLRLGRTPGDPEGEPADIGFDPGDPLEDFTNTLGYIPMVRSTAADGTGVHNPRQQVNTASSYIDAFAVYGPSQDRLSWLREGPYLLMDTGNYLPRRDARGDPDNAPIMEIDGHLRANPDRAMVAGDIRANENLGLTTTQTLFAREHNRIVDLLPTWLGDELRFQIARRVVGATQQYITYQEFLPALGVQLAPYRGYNPRANANLSNEFATVGYRGHSMIHGEFELETELARYSEADLAYFAAQGIEIAIEEDEVELAVPLNVAFFNPDLVPALQLGPLLQGFGSEAQYKNEEQLDNQIRSVLFQIPVPGNPDCLDGPTLPECFEGVVDLGAIDIARGRDHGIPSYNELRAAYGLAPKPSFTAITGEETASFPPGLHIDDPRILEFTELTDIDGNPVPIGGEDAVNFKRRSTLAARLNAIYGTPDNLDAFAGMMSEAHLPNSDFGELQHAIWQKQFEALRDGDRFFYRTDPALALIKYFFGIDYRATLAQVIAANTDIPLEELNDNVFVLAKEDES